MSDDFILGEGFAPNPQAMVLSCLLNGHVDLLLNAGVNGSTMSEPYRTVWFWVIGYVADYGEWPSVNRTKETYPDVHIPKWDDRPIDDVIDSYLHDLHIRQLRAAVIEVGKKLESGDEPGIAWSEWNEKIAAGQSRVNMQSWKETTEGRIDKYTSAVIAHELGEMLESGVLTGIEHIDKTTYGMLPGDYWLLLGRYDTGKTTLMAAAAQAAATTGNKCLIVSPEHNNDGMMRKLDALWFEADPVALRRGLLGTEFIEELKERSQAIREISGDIIVVSGEVFNVDSVGALINVTRPDIVYLDGLGHLVPFGTRQQDWLKVGETSRAVKHLAVKHQTPIMAVIQEAKGGGKNAKDNIARSDMIGRDADAIIHIEAISDTINKLVLAKYRETINRGGPCFLEKGKHGLSFTQINDPSLIGGDDDWNL